MWSIFKPLWKFVQTLSENLTWLKNWKNTLQWMCAYINHFYLCVIPKCVSLFHRVHALIELVSVAACYFLPHNSCTSSVLPFWSHFCQLGLLKNISSLDLESLLRIELSARSHHRLHFPLFALPYLLPYGRPSVLEPFKWINISQKLSTFREFSLSLLWKPR